VIGWSSLLVGVRVQGVADRRRCARRFSGFLGDLVV